MTNEEAVRVQSILYTDVEKPLDHIRERMLFTEDKKLLERVIHNVQVVTQTVNKYRTDRKGIVAVELALLLPVCLIMGLGFVDCWFMAMLQNSLQQTSNASALYASESGSRSTSAIRSAGQSNVIFPHTEITVSFRDEDNNTFVTATATTGNMHWFSPVPFFQSSYSRSTTYIVRHQ